MLFSPAYFVDHFSPAPAWHERAIPCPHAAAGMTVDTFFDMGKTSPAPFDVGKADKVWGFDPEGGEVLASFVEGIPMAGTLIPGETSSTPAICAKRGGKYGIHNDWMVLAIRCRVSGLQIPVGGDNSVLTDQHVVIYHIVRCDTPALSDVYTALTAIEGDSSIDYCGLNIMAGFGWARIFVESFYGFNRKIYPEQGMGEYIGRFDCRSAKNLYDSIRDGEASELYPDWDNDNPANLNTRLLLPFPYDFQQPTQNKEEI